MNSSRSKPAYYRTVPVGLPMGALGCVLVPALLPVPVLPVPARSCCMQLSLSVPIMFSHLLRPPTADGGAIGAGDELTEGVCDGVTAGV